jgi:hypothetical protein
LFIAKLQAHCARPETQSKYELGMAQSFLDSKAPAGRDLIFDTLYDQTVNMKRRPDHQHSPQSRRRETLTASNDAQRGSGIHRLQVHYIKVLCHRKIMAKKCATISANP